ncbi:MAG: tyrosine-type recombinase/integrase [Hyphomicrobiaceae bacterium]|nr:tyrosine-type recombinase/integrase [Hyphomicrobiaceae bacterium]
MRRKLTKAAIDAISPRARPIVIFDTELPGFALKALPSGKKVFQLRYRMGGRNTPKRTLTIGNYGVLTPDGARRQAQIHLGEIRRGVDPAGEKARKLAQDRSALTLAAVAADFMVLHAKAKRRSRTVEEYERLIERLIIPTFGSRRLKDISSGEVERWHHGLKATPYQANRALAVFSKLMSWAAQRGYRDGDNPCRAVEKFAEVARRRYLSPAEIANLGEAIRACEADGSVTVYAAAFFRLLLLTGMRKDELRLLTWDRVDYARRVLVLDELDSKTGRRDVPLSAPALQILHDIPRLGGNPYVFPGKRTGQPLVNVAKPWARVLAKAGIEATRVHDLRHSVGAVGVTTGASLLLIGGVLGHRSQQTTQRYAHLSDDPVRATAEAIGERVAAALDGKIGDLVSMQRR